MVEKFLEGRTAMVTGGASGMGRSMAGHPAPVWHQVIDVNLNGTCRTIWRALPGMIEPRWGRII